MKEINFKEFQTYFREELKEFVVTLNKNLVKYEKEPENQRLIQKIFRIFHTIKSSAASVGFFNLSTLAHKAEDILHLLRAGEIVISGEIISLLLSVVDRFQDLAGETAISSEDIEQLIKDLENYSKETTTPANTAVTTDKAPAISEFITHLSEYERSIVDDHAKGHKYHYCLTVTVFNDEELKGLRAELVFTTLEKECILVKTFPERDGISTSSGTHNFYALLLSNLSDSELESIISIDGIEKVEFEELNFNKGAFQLKDEGGEKHSEGTQNYGNNLVTNSSEAENSNIIQTSNTIRVSIDKLDKLFNLVGELIIASTGFNELEMNLRAKSEYKQIREDFSFVSNKVMDISSKLQYNIMRTRMLPISILFNQFPRVVRDLSQEHGKDIELELIGTETELDKKVIDEIGDALLHILRNAIDHGIESPEQRLKNGKERTGNITIEAIQVGNHIVISIRDDGSGIDLEEVRKKAVGMGYFPKTSPEKITEKELLKIIFEPGFSTSSKITTISGRGVGLDAVRSVVATLGGSVTIHNQPSAGCEFKIVLPLTVATTTVIFVRAGDYTCGIPVGYVDQIVKFDVKKLRTFQGNWLAELNGKPVPLTFLESILDTHSHKQISEKEIKVVVAKFNNERLGFIVDDVIGDQEIVVKPLEKNFRAIKGLSGAAILGNGKIIFILDILEIFNLHKNTLNLAANEYKKQLETEMTLEDEAMDENSSITEENAHSDEKKALTTFTTDDISDINRCLNKFYSEASDSLSGLLNRKVTIGSNSDPIFINGLELINQMLVNFEDLYFASILKMSKSININTILLLNEESGRKLFEIFMTSYQESPDPENADIIEGLGEINNILGSIFINNLANYLKVEIHPSPPINVFDMLGAIVQGVVSQDEFLDKTILYSDTEFHIDSENSLHAQLMTVLDSKELATLKGTL